MMPEKTPNHSTSAPLMSEMRCGLFSNEKGEILIVHDQEVKEPIQWVEYHIEENHIFFVYEDGASQDLGIEIGQDTRKNLVHGKKVTISLLKDKKIQASRTVTLLVQEY